jgi:16S rRNA processing protein RimM
MPPSRSAEGAPSPRLRVRTARRPELRDGYVAVGVVLTSFGLRGDMKVQPLSDVPGRFEAGRALFLGAEKRSILSSREHGGFLYLRLSGITTPEAIATLRGRYLEVPESERPALPPGEFYRSDIEGMTVVTTGGVEVGHVFELLETGANDVLVVRGEAGEALVPMIEDVIRDVDLASRCITIEPIEGLLVAPARRAEEPRAGRHARRRGASGRA